MNSQKVCESEVASLNDESADDVYRHSEVSRNPNLFGLDCIGASINLRPGYQAGVNTQAAAEASTKPRASTTVLLRPWIKQALNSIGSGNGRRAATSQAYLESALKIAKALTDQIVQADELFDRDGNSRNMDSLSITVCRDLLAEHIHVTVLLEEENHNNNEIGLDDELVSLPANENLESFLQAFERDVSANGDAVQDEKAVPDGEAVPNYNAVNKPNVNLGFKSPIQETYTFEEEQELSFPCLGSDVNYLHVNSAQIQCPEVAYKSRAGDSVKEESLRRMYYLGLVFYELFTGGEVPSENLRAIASCENAFVSLSTLTLVNKIDEDQTNTNDSSKRHQGLSSSDGDMGLCKLSCEYLRLIGIASPVCNLIFNMLDSVYGDLSGNESYTNMAQVASDLQLMIDKPSKFLRGLDMDKLAISGLPISEVEIPREEEFETIKSSYNRCISGSCEIAMIHGKSGTGKSWLASRVGNFVISQGGLVMTGKFDQMQQSKPFSGKQLSLCLLSLCE